jgi:hypothetical protein
MRHLAAHLDHRLAQTHGQQAGFAGLQADRRFGQFKKGTAQRQVADLRVQARLGGAQLRRGLEGDAGEVTAFLALLGHGADRGRRRVVMMRAKAGPRQRPEHRAA